MSEGVLQLRALTVAYPGEGHPVAAVRGVDLRVPAGGAVGVIGESGSGKTSLALASLMLLPDDARVGGSVTVSGCELVGASARTLRQVRWRQVACVVQSPGQGLNPVRRVGRQIAEPLRLRLGHTRRSARRRVDTLAGMVGLDDALLERYPHQLSGGELQRAMLALALAGDPQVLVLDEPTSGLDAASKNALLALLARLRAELGVALVVASHDIPAVAHISDELAVLYAGMVMEHGPADTVLGDPRHPYTRDLLACFPTMTTQKDLRGIRGMAPDPTDLPPGCPYHPRCTQAIGECATWPPERLAVAGREVTCLREGIVTRMAARGLSKGFRVGRHGRVTALTGIDLTVQEGEVVAVVGESGSGKTTLARALLGLTTPDAGTITWEGRDVAAFDPGEWQAFRRDAAIVYQDPFAAVSPRLRVDEALREPLDVQRVGSPAERDERVRTLLAQVGLPVTDELLARRAHDLSGGQLQRVAIARALALDPQLLVADEPTSMLDASEQAKVLALLKDLQVARGMAMVFISHDLALARKVADRLIVLHRGRVVESGPAHRVVAAPRSSEAAALIRAAPALEGSLSPTGDGDRAPVSTRP